VPRPAAHRRLARRRRGRDPAGGGWLMAESSTEERTEQATERRMKKVREEGQLSRSQDLSAWLGIGAAALALPLTLRHGTEAAQQQLVTVQRVVADPDPLLALAALESGLTSLVGTLAPVLVATCVAAVLGTVAQGRVHLKKLTLSAKNLDLVS